MIECIAEFRQGYMSHQVGDRLTLTEARESYLLDNWPACWVRVLPTAPVEIDTGEAWQDDVAPTAPPADKMIRRRKKG